jgi:hypothetical protein
MKQLILTLFLGLCLVFWSTAQTVVEETEAETGPWKVEASLGFDFTQLLQLNPKAGSGSDRIGLGGISSLAANYSENGWLWNNSASILFAVQRIGAGVSGLDPDKSLPFEKTIDELRLASNVGLQMSETSKWYYSLDFTFLSQLTSTYPGNLLSETASAPNPISRLLSPAQITLSPGAKYVPNENFNLFLSPASVKMIIVANDDIAALGIHGNPWTSETDFENTEFQFGMTAGADYTSKYFDDRLLFTSGLRLFTNYLENPQNIDVDWRNELAFQIVKGLNLSLNLNFFYDDDIPVQITDYDFPGGVKLDGDGNPVLGKRLNLTETLFLKYNYVF